jgi:hypothetical protein
MQETTGYSWGAGIPLRTFLDAAIPGGHTILTRLTAAETATSPARNGGNHCDAAGRGNRLTKEFGAFRMARLLDPSNSCRLLTAAAGRREGIGTWVV